MKHQIYSRYYSALRPLAEEFEYLPNTNYLFDLDHLSVIQVSGDKASECLQGQLSCDLRAVTDAHMRQGVMCNLKGRILAIFDVFKMTNQSLALVVPSDLSAGTQASLAKPAALSRVQLDDTTLKVYALFVQNEEGPLPLDLPLPVERYGVVHNERGWCYKIDDSFYMYIIEPEMAAVIIKPFVEHNQYRGSLAWHTLQLQHQRVEIYPESRGMFLPHRLNMHLSGHIDFEKGCYKGQEIIARMHYRSTQKHKLVSFVVDADEKPIAGASIYADDKETIVGEVIDYSIIDDHQYMILASVLISYPGKYYSI